MALDFSFCYLDFLSSCGSDLISPDIFLGSLLPCLALSHFSLNFSPLGYGYLNKPSFPHAHPTPLPS